MTEKEIGTYFLAKYTSKEIFLESQLQTAGAHEAKLLEKYAKSSGSLRIQAFMVKVALALVVLSMTIFPVMSYFEINKYFVTYSSSVEVILLVSSFLFCIYFLIIMLYIVM
ncbi:MAG: hypothetical protein ACFE8P_09910, partial [Promethearchaeota archaeon]